MAEAASSVGFRLSPQQERLWRLAAGAAGLAPFRSRGAVLVEGGLDVAHLERALARLAGRYEILRSSFRRISGMAVPLQVVGESAVLDLAAEWVEGDAAALARRAEAAFAELAAVPLDAERPAVAVRLLSRSATAHALVLAVPALQLDALGLRNLVAALLGGDEGGEGAPGVAAADDSLQYADLAEWQHDLLATAGGGGEFWRGQAGIAGPRATLPWELCGAGGFAPRRLDVGLPAALAAATGTAAARYGVSAADLLLSVWQALGSRLLDPPGAPLGVACDGRAFEGLDGQLGLFARYLPMALAGGETAGLAAAARRTRRTVAEAQGWQEHFDWRQDAAAADGEPWLCFGFDYHAAWSGAAAGRHWRVQQLDACLDRFTVRLSVLGDGERLTAALIYDHGRLGDVEAAFLGERFTTLLAAALAAPETPLAELDLVGPAERRFLVEELNRSDRSLAGAGRCLHELIFDQGQGTPERIAVAAGTDCLTYAELAAAARRLARRLRDAGVGPEVRVAIWGERSLDLPVAMLGIWEAGGAYVPLDPAYPGERLRRLVEGSAAALALAPAAAAGTLAAISPAPVLALAAAAAPAAASAEPSRAGWEAATPANLAYVLFTSGSTGEPKGVMVPHSAILNRLLWMQRVRPLGDGDVVLQKTPASFDASIWEIFLPLLCGARLHLAPPGAHRDSAQLVELVERAGITVLQLVPSQLRQLLAEPRLPRCLSLRRVFCGGEALPRELVDRAAAVFAGEICNLYGPTECAIDVAWHPARGDATAGGGPTVPIGRPIDNLRLHVLDRQLGLAAAGLAGELCAAGAGLARGYAGLPDATARAFVPDPFAARPGGRLYRTGDLVRRLPTGVLAFLGRVDQQLKIRGIRVEPGEIEAALVEHPAVAQAAVVPHRLASGDLQLAAYVVLRQGAPAAPAAADLRAFLAGRLPEGLVPAHFAALPELPRLPSGKLDRTRLAAAELPADTGGEEPDLAAPRDPLAEIVAGIFAVLLERPRVRPSDSFFDLGGHSLLATQVAARVRAALDVEMPMRTLFDHPTPAGLAAALASLRAGGGHRLPPIRPAERSGALPLSAGQERLWLVDRLAPGNLAYNLPFLVELPPQIEIAALAAALGRVVGRHEALRTRFPLGDGRPVQRIDPAPARRLDVVDLAALPPAAAAAACEALAAAAAHRPFDLARGPLLRATVLVAAGWVRALFVLHHIASDGWSVGILLREIEALYAAACGGGPDPLPPLPVQYADYAVWQRDWLAGSQAAEQLAAATHRLAGAPRVMALPLDRPRPPVPSFRGATRSAPLAPQTVAGLTAFARREGVTLFMALLAAWNLLLHQLTGQRDLVVGSPAAGRSLPELEGLIGVFINVLVLRNEVSASGTVGDLLAGVRATTLAAFATRELPFERLVKELESERGARHSPLFQVLFALQNAPVGRLRLAGETLAVRPLATGQVQFDLVLSVNEIADGAICQLGFSTAIFDAATIERLERRLFALLARLAAPDLAVAGSAAALLELPAAERDELLLQGSPAAAAGPAGEVLGAAPRQARPTFLAGRTPREQALAAIWARTLGLPRVGVHDNFFDLGGDSILCIQAVARANEQGFRLTPRDLFQHQTVAVLAALAPAAAAAAAEQGLVAGEAPLTPIARRFFAHHDVAPHHFNQAVLLTLAAGSGAAWMAAAVRRLVLHHDALRLRFTHSADGWRQFHGEARAAAAGALVTIDLTAVPADRASAAVARAAADVQSGFDLTRGPLFRAVLFPLAAPQRARLLLVAHHLVVDGVSWRILLGDLEALAGQLERGEAPRLPPKTTSFKRWAEQLAAAAASAPVQAEKDHWLAPAKTRLLPLPRDLAGGNAARGAQSVTVSLDAARTEILLRRAVQPYRTRVDHLLLAAVAGAFARWTRSPALLVDAEGHGREDIAPGLDLSRTVGWFTSVYPVLLRVPPPGNERALIQAVKEQVENVPNRGIGYGLLRHLWAGAAAAFAGERRAEVSFNYLGQLDRILGADSPYQPAPEPAGAAEDGRHEREYLIDVNAQVAAGELQVSFTYGAAVHRRATIEKLAADFHAALERLIEHCAAPGAGGFTPSDFPLVRLDQATLDRLTPAGDEVDDIYPQSPLQQGLFFHALLAPHSGDYIVQRSSTLAGELDVEALRRAWEILLARHTVLRTSFVAAGLKVPVQRVHRTAALPWTAEDWRELPPDEQRTRLDAYLVEDRRRGFDPARPPLLRLAVFQLDDRTWELIWTSHHLLLDGWSMARLSAEIFDLYRALQAGGEPPAAPAAPYRDYIAWIERQDRAECEAYWRRTLAGVARPTLAAAPVAARAGGEEVAQGWASVELTPRASEDLRAFAHDHQLTLGTLTQAAVALVVGRMAQSQDVVIGLTMAGRPADLDGVDRRIGLFSNTLPVRVRIAGEEPLLAWLHRLQERRLESSLYEYSPLVDVQTWSGLPAGTPLFDTILTYQNFPLDSSLDQSGLGLEIRRAEQSAQNSNPLTFLAVPGKRFVLDALYDPRAVAAPTAEAALRSLALLLQALAEPRHETVGALLAVLDAARRADEEAAAQSFAQATRDRLRRRPADADSRKRP